MTTSRRLLFTSSSLSTTTDVPIFFGPQPQCSSTRLIRSRRLKGAYLCCLSFNFVNIILFESEIVSWP